MFCRGTLTVRRSRGRRRGTPLVRLTGASRSALTGVGSSVIILTAWRGAGAGTTQGGGDGSDCCRGRRPRGARSQDLEGHGHGGTHMSHGSPRLAQSRRECWRASGGVTVLAWKVCRTAGPVCRGGRRLQGVRLADRLPRTAYSVPCTVLSSGAPPPGLSLSRHTIVTRTMRNTLATQPSRGKPSRGPAVLRKTVAVSHVAAEHHRGFHRCRGKPSRIDTTAQRHSGGTVGVEGLPRRPGRVGSRTEGG